MNPFGTRGAADFARALDGGTAGTLPHLVLAQRLRTAGARLDDVVAPRAEFRDALRQRLLAVATVQAAATASARAAAPATAVPTAAALTWRRRTGAVAAGTMASVVAVSGVAVAGSQSLPGDPFYGVKKTAEAFQLRTADGAVEKGAQHLDFAATRLREVRGLALGRDSVDGPVSPTAQRDAMAAADPEQVTRVKQTLSEMDDQTRVGTELLNEAFRAARSPEPLRVLGSFARRQSEGLEQLLPALPSRAQDRARISLALLTVVATEADAQLERGACAAGCDPTQAAPVLPAGPSGAPSASAPCACTTPAPVPAPGPTAPTTPDEPTDEPTAAPSPEPSAEPSSAPSPAPSPSPSSAPPSPSPSAMPGGLPLPVPPLPVPLPPLPVPVPTLSLPPVPAAGALAPAGTTGPATTRSSTSSRTGSGAGGKAPAAPAPAPLPAVAPVAPRP